MNLRKNDEVMQGDEFVTIHLKECEQYNIQCPGDVLMVACLFLQMLIQAMN